MQRPADHISNKCPFMPSTLSFNLAPSCDDSSSSDEEIENDVNQNKSPLIHPGSKQVLLNLIVPEEKNTAPISEHTSPIISSTQEDQPDSPPVTVNKMPFVPEPDSADHLESDSNPADHDGRSASSEPWYTPKGKLSPRDRRALKSSAKNNHSSRLPDGSLIFRGRRFLTKKCSFCE